MHRSEDRPGLRRALPFAAAAGLALLTTLIPPSPALEWVGVAALVTVALVLSQAFVPWARPPRPLAVVPPLLFLLVVAILRDATGGSGSGFAPLALLSIFWVALYGRRWQLVVVIVAVGLTFIVPLTGMLGGEYGSKDIRYSIIWVVVSSLIGLTANRLVSHQREQQRRLSEQHDFLEAMFVSAGSLVAVLETNGRVQRINPACERIGGFNQEEIVGRYFWDVLLPSEAVSAVAERWRGGDVAGLTGVTETKMVSRGGEGHAIHWTLAPLRDDWDRTVAFVATGIDVTAERAAREALRGERDRFDSVLHAATEYSIIGTDPDGLITVFNEGAERMLGYRAGEMIGKRTPEILHVPAEIEQRAAELGVKPGFEVFVHEARSGRADTRDWTYVLADDSRITVSLTVTAIMDAEGEPEGFIGIATDVSAARAAEAALAESESRFRTLVEHLPDAVIALYDRDLRLQMAEGPMLAKQGLDPEYYRGKTLEQIFPAENAATLRAPLEAALSGYPTRTEYESHRNGVVYEVEFVPYLREGEVRGAYTVSRDVTERKRFEEELRRLAEHDPLTGLLNRRRFEQELQRHLAQIARYGESGALVLFDVDDFKSVNDTLGHAKGDELIVAIARAVGEELRESDEFARLGGDEFAILLREADPEEAAALAARLVACVRERCGTMLPGGVERQCSISVGVVPFDIEAHLSPDGPLVAADLAMYEAKRAGGDRFQLLSRPGPRRPRPSERGAAAGSAPPEPGC